MTQPTLFDSEEPSEFKVYQSVYLTKSTIHDQLENESDNLSPKQRRFLREIEKKESELLKLLIDLYPGLKRYLS